MSNLETNSSIHFLNDLSFWSAQFGLKLLDKIKLKTNAKVLDIGTGLGFPAIELAMRLGDGAEVFGIDPWLDGIDYAKEKSSLLNLQNVKFLKQYAENMSFDDQYFDSIVSNIGLNNVQNLDMTLLECARVAKSNAQLVFSTYSSDYFPEFYSIFYQVLKEFKLMEDIDQILTNIDRKLFPKEEIRFKLEKSGFKISSICDEVFTMKFASGTEFLNHHFIWQVFYPVWYNAVNENYRKPVFDQLENALNEKAKERGEFSVSIPFAIFDCYKN